MSCEATLEILGTAVMLSMVGGVVACLFKGELRQIGAVVVAYPLILLPFWLVAWVLH